MTLPASGAISMSQVATELGGSLPLSLRGNGPRNLVGDSGSSSPITLPTMFYSKKRCVFTVVPATSGTFTGYRVGLLGGLSTSIALPSGVSVSAVGWDSGAGGVIGISISQFPLPSEDLFKAISIDNGSSSLSLRVDLAGMSSGSGARNYTWEYPTNFFSAASVALQVFVDESKV